MRVSSYLPINHRLWSNPGKKQMVRISHFMSRVIISCAHYIIRAKAVRHARQPSNQGVDGDDWKLTDQLLFWSSSVGPAFSTPYLFLIKNLSSCFGTRGVLPDKSVAFVNFSNNIILWALSICWDFLNRIRARDLHQRTWWTVICSLISRGVLLT